MNPRILALDLGTHTGVCHNLNGALEVRTVQLAKPAEVATWGKTRLTRRNDPRIERLFQLLKSFPKPDVVLWEDVLFSSYTAQVQLWSSFRTVVWLAFGNTCVLECVPVSALKKFATNSGAADKKMMTEALKRQHPEISSCISTGEDDSVDAAWLYLWAEKNLSRLKV